MAASNSAKQKEIIIPRDKKHFLYDMVKSDGQFKEMIGMQELARDTWINRWGFMNKEHILMIYEEHAAKLNLPLDFMINRRRKKTFEREYSGKQPVVASAPVPTLSSGMVGWRSSDQQCSLEVVGPLFVSPTTTIEPPRRPSDLPLHQSNILLG